MRKYLVLFFIIFFFSALMSPQSLFSAPTEQEIIEAVKNLGSDEWDAREEAEEILWKAGKAAEPYLKKAIQSDDRETVQRAQRILDKFNAGLYPDTPKEIVELYNAYLEAGDAQKIEIIKALLIKGEEGSKTMLTIAEREAGTEVGKNIMRIIGDNVKDVIPDLLYQQKYDQAERLLYVLAGGLENPALNNYALFQLLTDKLDATIKRMTKEYEATENKTHPYYLTFLYRVKGDLKNVLKYAKLTKNKGFLDDINYEFNNWKDIADFNVVHDNRRTDRTLQALSFKAEFLRLSGKMDEHAKVINDIKQISPRMKWQLPAALLVCGEFDAAIKNLKEIKDYEHLFAVLDAKYEYPEIVSIYKSIDQEEEKISVGAKLAVAKAYYRLGLKDKGKAVFEQIASDPSSAIYASQATLTAFECDDKDFAVKFTAPQMDPNEVQKSNRFFMYMFKDNAKIAKSFYDFLLAKYPNEDLNLRAKKFLILNGYEVLDDNLKEAFEKETKDYFLKTPAISEETLIAAAKFFLNQKDLVSAKIIFSKAANEASSYSAFINLGDLARAEKKYEEAIKYYDEAYKNKDKDLLARFLKGKCLIALGKKQEGETLIKQTRIFPLTDILQRFEFAQQLKKRSFLDEAFLHNDLVLKSGYFFQWKIVNFPMILPAYTKPFYVRHERALENIKNKKYEAAVDDLLKHKLFTAVYYLIYKDFADYVNTQYIINSAQAQSYIQSGNGDLALKEINKCIKLRPTCPKALLMAYEGLSKAGKKAEADKMLNQIKDNAETLLSKYPNVAGAHFGLSHIYKLQENNAKAEEHLKKANDLGFKPTPPKTPEIGYDR